MTVIGMNGYAGSGKSTAARILVSRFGFVEMKFAKWLKDMLRALGLTDREIEGDLKEVPNPILGGQTPRYAMQMLGTEWGRKLIHDNLWVGLAQYAVSQAEQSGLKRIVFSDCRYPNEARLIQHTLGGSVWRLVRPQGGEVGAHSSERIQSEIRPDLIIDNSGTVDDLEERISMAWLRLVNHEITQ